MYRLLSSWNVAYMSTMKGCDVSARTLFSLRMCSTCFSRTTSDFFILLSARKQFVAWLIGSGCLAARCLRSVSASTSRTRPKVPVPSVSFTVRSSSALSPSGQKNSRTAARRCAGSVSSAGSLPSTMLRASPRERSSRGVEWRQSRTPCAPAKQIEEFEACLLSGLPNGAPKGTELEFATGGSKLSVSVNQKPLGAVGSKALCSAFAAIYTDRNAVCTMNAAGEGAQPAACGLLSPARKGALVGAGVGYLAGKVLG
mmetsp:Transcript_23157/g.68657  ORF Transcript_23157/g.68657 Transcript_23157/m.68657 type:complete len:256 (+) Transcript_23157:930-1697(+)